MRPVTSFDSLLPSHTTIEIAPDDRILSWDNARLELAE